MPEREENREEIEFLFTKAFETCENSVSEEITEDIINLNLEYTEQETNIVMQQANARFLMKQFDVRLHRTPAGEEPSEMVRKLKKKLERILES